MGTAEPNRTARVVAMLRRGDDGAAVLDALRSECATPRALSVAISRVRAAAFAALPAPPCDALAPVAADDPDVARFLTLPLGERVKVQRAHRSDPTWCDEAEAVLASLELLPANVAALRLTPRELVSLKRTHEGALIAKQEALVHVHGGWLAFAVRLARESRAEMSYARLALPLLLLSGRRTAELLSGASTFAPTARATTCAFAGQLKKRGAEAMRRFEIPLLCDYATFAHGLGALREKQGGVVLTPKETNVRYAKNLSLALPCIFPVVETVHQLRGVYAALAFHLYACESTFNRAAMRVLGHDKLDVSLAYNGVVLHPLLLGERGCLGPLP